jgi:hypothetical protein
MWLLVLPAFGAGVKRSPTRSCDHNGNGEPMSVQLSGSGPTCVTGSPATYLNTLSASTLFRAPLQSTSSGEQAIPCMGKGNFATFLSIQIASVELMSWLPSVSPITNGRLHDPPSALRSRTDKD